MNDQVEQIKANIFEAIDSDQIVLPTLPEVALQVRTAAADDNVNVKSLAGVISNDAALSVRVIKVANSPLLRASEPIEDLYTAVGRLGITYTANFATGLAMRQMFLATSPIVEQRMRDIWSKSTEVAGISHVLASQYSKIKPDQATLAGLVHKIGALPILTYAEGDAALLEDGDALDAIIEQAHPAIGCKILQAWDFPEELRIVPEEHIEYQRQRDVPDLTDIVMVANLQSYIGTDHPSIEMDWSRISAFSRLGIDCEIDSLQAEDLTEEMEAAAALLQ